MAASLQVLQHEKCHAQGEHCKWPAQDSCNVCSLGHLIRFFACGYVTGMASER